MPDFCCFTSTGPSASMRGQLKRQDLQKMDYSARLVGGFRLPAQRIADSEDLATLVLLQIMTKPTAGPADDW